jgi:hypothetical protein
MMIEFFKHMEWKMLGRDHVATKIPCQDSVAYASHQGVQVMAVSDGAGSRTHSQYGSNIAVQQITQLLSQQFRTILTRMEKKGKKKSVYDNDQTFLKDWFLSTMISEMDKFAKTNAITLNDMASTLLFVAFNDDYYVTGHVGDGLIASIHGIPGQDYTKLVSEPDGEANETFFITMPKIHDHFRLSVGSMDDIRGFIISSDGLQDRIFQKKFGLSTNLNTFVQAYYGKTNLEYQDFIEKLITNRWTDLNDDLSFGLIMKEHQPLDESKKPYLLNMLSNIKSKDQIIKLSQYAYLANHAKAYKDLDYLSTEALIERLVVGI